MKKSLSLFSLVLLLSFQMSNLALALEPVFSDISDHEYEYAIDYVQNKGIVTGYDNGTYRPDNLINRAEFTKILVEHLYDKSDFDAFTTQSCFTDVLSGEWYTRYVCFAKDKHIIAGHPDGSFQPSNNINYIEALKIVIEANEAKGTLDLGLTEVGKYWYSRYIDFVQNKCAAVAHLDFSTACLSLVGKLSLDEEITRAEAAVMIQWMGLLTQ